MVPEQIWSSGMMADVPLRFEFLFYLGGIPVKEELRHALACP